MLITRLLHFVKLRLIVVFVVHLCCSAKKILHEVKKCAVWIALVQPKTSFKVIDMERCVHFIIIQIV